MLRLETASRVLNRERPAKSTRNPAASPV